MSTSFGCKSYEHVWISMKMSNSYGIEVQLLHVSN
ncbi:hypothetical protein LINPERPRIM_LOCUS13394, partial [Linum perenne]